MTLLSCFAALSRYHAGYARMDEGRSVRVPLESTLGHVFNHATHHRSQLSAALTVMGRAGPDLDWVSLLQQESCSP